MSDGFAAAERAHGVALAEAGVVGRQLGAAPVDARVVVHVVEHAVRLVRLVERVVDERVGYLAQAAPAGPRRLARVVRHDAERRRRVVPALAARPIHAGVLVRFTRAAVGAPTPRRPDQQAELTRLIPRRLLALVAVHVRAVRIERRHIELAAGFRVLQARMVHFTSSTATLSQSIRPPMAHSTSALLFFIRFL